MSSLLRNVGKGFLLALVYNIWVIISIKYTITNFVYYCVIPLLTAIIVFYMFGFNGKKGFALSILISTLSFIVMVILIAQLGIISKVYSTIYQDTRKTAGDGFNIMIIYFFNFIGSCVGFLSSIVFINKKHNSTSEG